MAQYIFRLPDIGEGIAEAEIVAWHVKPGDRLEEHQPLVDVMTDKATVEMTSPKTGVVAAIHGEVGQPLRVGAPLVTFELDQTQAAAEPHPPKRALAAPVTRRRAKELGVPLEAIPGTGPDGRITARDLDHFAAGKSAPRDGVTEIRITGLRRKIAEKMQDSARRIPHFSYIEEFDLTALEALRARLNTARTADQPKLTLLPFMMRALVHLVPDFPQINARYDDKAEILCAFADLHIGIATQTKSGLMVPVVRHAQTRDLWDCARELARVTAVAREGGASPAELTGATLTLSSLGALGGIAATPIVNAPEVAILAPNKLVDRPVVLGGQIVIRTMMNFSSSFDHRIVDGYDAARFVQGLKQILEHPERFFVSNP
ncbi:MAG: branched-chain alpha-keto acid dehydrogenase subunit E2 [Acidocella sp. 20-63-7]|nr:MAG: branched-chain alpha-keto acid dehydrogenase subunit E2 [Acidocella sp. 20-63-7]HQT47119.1 dihydrolipoamide acetyltransferase family protein [Acidocella sp.]